MSDKLDDNEKEKCSSVGKAEDKSISIETGKNLSYAPKSEKEKCEHDPKYIILLKEILPNHELLSCVICKKEWATVPDYVEEIRSQTRKETNEINKEYYEFVKKETAKAIFEDMDKIVCLNVSAFSPTIEEYSKIRKKYGVDA